MQNAELMKTFPISHIIRFATVGNDLRVVPTNIVQILLCNICHIKISKFRFNSEMNYAKICSTIDICAR